MNGWIGGVREQRLRRENKRVWSVQGMDLKEKMCSLRNPFSFQRESVLILGQVVCSFRISLNAVCANAFAYLTNFLLDGNLL